MDFFNTGVDVIAKVIMGIGGITFVGGVINYLEGYSGENPASKAQGQKQAMAGAGIFLVASILVPVLKTFFS